MTFWVTIWQICFIVALSLFAVVAIAVTVGGAFDIVRLFRRLGDSEEIGDGD